MIDKKQQLIEYLYKDKYQNIGAISALKRFEPKDIQIINGGVSFVIYDDLHIISYDKENALITLLDNLYNDDFVYICQYDEKQFERLGISFNHITPCKQFVYKENSILEENEIDGVTFISPIPTSYAKSIYDNYTMKTHTSIEDITINLTKEQSVGALIDGNLAAFVGMHSEGSMGLMEVLPKYRGRGLAIELSNRIINAVYNNGEIPYGHIVYGNIPSLGLQNKLNTEYTKDVVWASIKKNKYKIDNLIVRRFIPKDYPLWKNGVDGRNTPQNQFDVGRVDNTDKKYFYDYLSYMGSRESIDKTYLYGIFDSESNKQLGVVEFTILLRDGFNWGMYGISIHNQYWGQGIASKITKLADSIAINLGIHRLEAVIEVGNNRSEALVIKNGYNYEGIKKDFFSDESQNKDALVYYKILGE